MTSKDRNGEKDITSIQNESPGHPQEPPGHENHHMATAAIDISNLWIWPDPSRHVLEEIFKAMYIFDLR